MQPEPSAVSQKEPTESTKPETNTSHQHGRYENDAAVSLSPAAVAGTWTTTSTAPEQVAADAAFATSLQTGGDETVQEFRRLSPKSTPSPPPGYNRIVEYEKASTPPIRKREGPAFEVIKKYRSPGDKRSPIQELPNGSCNGYI